MLKKELDIINQAIMNEIEGYEFYKMASNQIGTGDTKEAFLMLAEEELRHVEFLKQLLDKIKDGKSDDIYLAYDSNPPSPEIYKWEKIDKENTSLAMTVYGIGMNMEKDSIEFYTKAKEDTEIKEAKELYDLLIKWEHVHLSQFSEQYELYRKEWWDDQHFAPF